MKPLASELALSVPNYTEHGINHCDSLWDTASLLVDESFPINPTEAFVLGGAFLVHDLGMGIQAYSGGLSNIVSSLEWQDLLAMLHPEDHRALQDQLQRDIAKNPTWNGLSDVRVKDALTTFLRDHHAEQAEKLVRTEWELSNGQKFYLIADTRLRFWCAELIGRIGRSHWVPVDDLPKLFPSTLGAPAGYPTDWTIDPLKVACLMRLADATQIDARRADPLHTPHRAPQGTSIDHWKFQERMLYPQPISRRLYYTSATALDYSEAEAWWLAYDTAKMIDEELRKVDALCGDLSKPQFTVSAVAGVESPDRFAKFVQTTGWRPIDARPRITNSNSVIAKLGGATLYGQHSWDREIVIRELLANALDATRARRLGVGTDGLKPVRVSLRSDNSRDSLIVRDYGIGMTESEVIENLCDFGNSGWRSKRLTQQFPGLLTKGFTPTGQFGIGFFSIFMIADDVTVITRSINQALDETIVLDFKGGPGGRPLLRRAVGGERLGEPGTEVRAHLKYQLGSKDGLFESAVTKLYSTNDIFASYIRNLALMSDEDIETSALQETEFVRAVVAKEWESITESELFDALNVGVNTLISAESLDKIRTEFASSLSPIYDKDNNMIGRVGLHLGWDHIDDIWFSVDTFSMYCGGLKADTDSRYSGIMKGSPTRARRDQTKVDLSLDDMVRWFETQRPLLESRDLKDEIRLQIQDTGVMLGVRSEGLPIAWGPNGYMTPDGLREYIADRSTLYILEEFPSKLEIGDEVHTGFQSRNDKFCLIADGMINVGYTYFAGSEFSTFPVRPDEFEDKWRSYSKDEVGFDPIYWWRRRYPILTGEVMRIVSEVWEIELSNLISNVKHCDYVARDGIDSRIDVPCVGGGSGKTDAYLITRSS
ncbi:MULTISPECIES: ATP-binding protein [Mycolicibacterium]|nr:MULTISPECIES: ATP-binding protein [Mycolicibacterium]MCW1819953.1 ATP-binding protein [Mycolicibacterium senegalense]